ncbi:unannotated protein [freshwater metagenome]|uniref:Unannotated protein n=1 Tax=freshwater metagenome TaxID=449393 RepID=A0A6J7L4F8_9ZZZZ
MSAMRFEGKTAIVTGGGGQIGAATCVRLAAEGATVLVVDISNASVNATIERIRAQGGTAEGFVADVTDSAQVAAYAKAGAALGGGVVDMFYNNAGIEGVVAPVTEHPDDEFDKVIAVNVKGVFLGLKHVIPYMRAGGTIVNTGSMAGVVGAAGCVAYIASKHAVIGITRTVALEQAPLGIRVNAVCPGAVKGRMMESLEDGFGAGSREVVIGRTPMGRYAEHEEIAAMVAFLLSEDSSYSTGALFMADGGQTAS